MAHHAKPAPAKPTQSHGFLSVANPSENNPSKNLWIGSVMPDVTDSELKALFESHGEIAGVRLYPSRNFAYVYFREIESARSAMQGLQGHLLRGNRLKIEFAKPQTFPQAKPCSSLLVALISRSVTKEDLQREFLKFGSIKKVSFLRDSNTAYIDFVRLEDATQALTCMNGKRIGGDQIRVDFWRGEQGPDANQVQFSSTITATSEYRWMAKDSSKSYPQPSLAGTMRQNQFLYTVPPKHYEKAIGFSTVCFLHDSESDFAAYMEFMSYLVCKDRIGIIRFNDYTPIFLVPPKFLSKVLKVSGPECLYGVLLKFSVVASTSTSMNPPSTQNREPCTKEKVQPEVSKVPPKTPSPVNSCGQKVQSVRPTLVHPNLT